MLHGSANAIIRLLLQYGGRGFRTKVESEPFPGQVHFGQGCALAHTEQVFPEFTAMRKDFDSDLSGGGRARRPQALLAVKIGIEDWYGCRYRWIPGGGVVSKF